MAAYDFFSPFFEAMIVTPDKKKLILTPGSRENPGLDFYHVPIAESLSVKLTPSSSMVSVSLKPMNRDMGLALLGDPSVGGYSGLNEFVKLHNRLSVRWGYASDALHQTDWLNVSMDPPSITLGQMIDITLNAKGLNKFAQSATAAKVFGGSETGLPKQHSAEDIIKVLVKRNGWHGPIYMPGAESSPPGEMKRFTEKKNSYIISGLSGWDYIEWLCAYNLATPELRGNTLVIYSWLKMAEIEPKIKFVYHSGEFGKDNVFPITGSVNLPLNSLFAAKKGDAVVQHLSLNKKKSVKVEAGAKTTKVKTINDGGELSNSDVGSTIKDEDGIFVGKIKEDKRDAGKMFPRPPREERDSKDIADSLYINGMFGVAGVTLEFDTIGVPNVADPGSIVAFEFGSSWLSGNYRVINVSHDVGSGGYNMSIKGISLGVNKDLVSKKAKGEKNAAGGSQKKPEGGGGGNAKVAI
jgi:hypothetical protein